MNEYLDYIKQGQKTELIIRTPGGAVRFFSTFEKQTDTNIIISKPKNKHLAFNCIPNQDVELYAYTNGGVQVKIFAPSGRGGIEQTVTVPGNADDENLKTAVAKVKAIISERIKRYNLEEDNQKYEMMVLYEYKSVADWLRLLKELNKAPYVKSVKEDAIGAGRVQFRMEYTGSLNRLEQVLNSRGLNLQAYDGFYVIAKK